MIFINAGDPNRINYDLDEKTSWKNTPRLISLKKDEAKISVCLYGLHEKKLPAELLPSLGRMSDWASLYTSSFMMKEGFYPLLLDGQTLFFTNKEEYSMMDQYWAFDNIYKIQIEDGALPQFETYTLEKPEDKGWQRGIINAQSIRVGDLFAVVSKEIPKITEFCSAYPQSNMEISYSDRYIKTELALSICLQFIKDLIATIQPSTYKVIIISATFNEPNANAEDHRRLTELFISDINRDETGRTLINDGCYEFISKPKEDIPHYRELLVKATKGGTTHTLRIMPDAGLAHWGLDIQQCTMDRCYYSTNNGVNSQIPIRSNTEQVYYVNRE